MALFTRQLDAAASLTRGSPSGGPGGHMYGVLVNAAK